MNNKHEAPKQADFGRMVAFLAQAGFAGQELARVIGNTPKGRTRGEIADELRVWLKDRLG